MLGKKDSPSLNAARQGKQIKVAIIIVFITQNIKSKIPFSINSNTISFPMKNNTAASPIFIRLFFAPLVGIVIVIRYKCF